MAILKCKMCGGDLRLLEGKTTAECEYCGSIQTVPVVDDEKKLTLFNRANRLRFACEFDKAAGVYESIVAEFPEEAEAYWGLLLCKFGIEYVDDPKTGKKIPTCHRSSFESVLDDSDFELVMEYSDVVSRAVYRAEAKVIEELRKSIIEVSSKEEPYDIFICYKETDEKGNRTLDSVIAQDVYTVLTEKGYRVFFSRITLEDKLGVEYEPFIFAALNSAKIMLAFGTDYEYYNAVWVKNEWSRFLQLIAAGQKKTLIPCYKNIDAYDMPKEFAKLQAQDMGKVGAMQDLLRGIEKILPKKTQQAEQTTVVVQAESNSQTDALVKRGYMALEDGDWARADEFFEQALNADAELADAYLGKFLAGQEVKTADAFVSAWLDAADRCPVEKKEVSSIDDQIHSFAKEYAVAHFLSPSLLRSQFAQLNLKYSSKVAGRERYLEQAKALLASNRLLLRAEQFGSVAVVQMKEQMLVGLQQLLDEAVQQDDDSVTQIQKEFERFKLIQEEWAVAEAARLREKAYQSALESCAQGNYLHAMSRFKQLGEYKDSASQAEKCRELQMVVDNQQEKKAKRAKALTAICIVLVIGFIFVLIKFIIPANQYKNAIELMDEGQYSEAAAVFAMLDEYKDSRELCTEAEYKEAVTMMETGQLYSAVKRFVALGNYKDAKEKTQNLWEQITQRQTILAASVCSAAVKSDGTVVATKYYDNNYNGQSDVSGWGDIIALAAGDYHTVGLKSDGTVVATKYYDTDDYYGQCDVLDWEDIVAITAATFHTVGLKADGTVVATKYLGAQGFYDGQCEVSDWEDIIAIAAGDSHTVGLKSDGTVIATKYKGTFYFGQCDVWEWEDVVAIAAGDHHTIGLKADGTVVASGSNGFGQCEVSGWKDIVAIAAGSDHTVGLKSDGTVVASGSNGFGRCEVSGWKDIVAIAAGDYHTIGLKADGTVVATEYPDGDMEYYSGQCDVSSWKGIKLPNNSLTKEN